MKGQEASSWLKMVTRKMKLVPEVLSDTVHNVSPPQARKNRFIWMGHLYGALSPGTTCWPGGGLKCSPGVGGSKMASRGVELLLTPPTPTYAYRAVADEWTLAVAWPLLVGSSHDPALQSDAESSRGLEARRDRRSLSLAVCQSWTLAAGLM